MKTEKYSLYSLGQIRMKLTAIVQTAERNQANSQKSGQDDGVIPNVFEISSYDERLDDLPILEIFKIWDVVAKRTSTSEDYVCNQFKSLSLPLQVLPLDIVENENSLL